MTASSSDGPERGGDARREALARRERELEQFRANIERLRRERAARIDEFGALTRQKSDPTLPPREGQAPADGDHLRDDLRAAPGSTPTAPGDAAAVTADRYDRVGARADACDADVDLPDEPEPDAGVAPPDESLDFGALAEEDTVVDAKPRRAADQRRMIAAALAGAAAVAAVAFWIWGPWSRGGRTESPAASSTPAGESAVPVAPRGGSMPASEDASVPDPVSRPAPPEPSAPVASATRPLVVQLVTSREAWLRAVVDGRQVLNRSVPAGETITLEADALVSVRIGDAGAVRVSVNGQDRGLAGRDGQVLTARFDAKQP